MTFHSLRDLLPRTANKFGLKGELQAALVLQLATDSIREALPDQVSDQLVPKRFSKGELWFESGSSVVSHQLQLKSQQLIGLINQKLGQELVKSLRTC
ncbi:MAG: DUF721 domain-containing protein [bacterium]|nr:DUF721 domain-containing protein [bacterium]